MSRALVALAGASLLALLLGLARSPHPAAAVVLALLFTALATVGFAWVRSRGPRARAAYFALQLPLGILVFGLAGATTGGGLLLVLLVIQAVLVLPLGWAVVVAALTPLAHVGMAGPDAVREGVGMLVASAFAMVLTLLHLREQQARAELAVANAQLRRSAEQAEELATVRERNRVARDIHDGLGHHLTVVQMQLQAAGAVIDHDTRQAAALLAKAQHQTREALSDVRRSVSSLREAPALPALPEGLATLARDTSDVGIDTAVAVRGTARDVSAETAESLFRTAQEGLTNVRKHSGAAQARVVLDYTRPDVVRLEVHDDGGRPVEDAGAGFGLRGLGERVRSLGGGLVLERADGRADGRGHILRVELPG